LGYALGRDPREKRGRGGRLLRGETRSPTKLPRWGVGSSSPRWGKPSTASTSGLHRPAPGPFGRPSPWGDICPRSWAGAGHGWPGPPWARSCSTRSRNQGRGCAAGRAGGPISCCRAEFLILVISVPARTGSWGWLRSGRGTRVGTTGLEIRGLSKRFGRLQGRSKRVRSHGRAGEEFVGSSGPTVPARTHVVPHHRRFHHAPSGTAPSPSTKRPGSGFKPTRSAAGPSRETLPSSCSLRRAHHAREREWWGAFNGGGRAEWRRPEGAGRGRDRGPSRSFGTAGAGRARPGQPDARRPPAPLEGGRGTRTGPPGLLAARTRVNGRGFNATEDRGEFLRADRPGFTEAEGWSAHHRGNVIARDPGACPTASWSCITGRRSRRRPAAVAERTRGLWKGAYLGGWGRWRAGDEAWLTLRGRGRGPRAELPACAAVDSHRGPGEIISGSAECRAGKTDQLAQDLGLVASPGDGGDFPARGHAPTGFASAMRFVEHPAWCKFSPGRPPKSSRPHLSRTIESGVPTTGRARRPRPRKPRGRVLGPFPDMARAAGAKPPRGTMVRRTAAVLGSGRALDGSGPPVLMSTEAVRSGSRPGRAGDLRLVAEINRAGTTVLPVRAETTRPRPGVAGRGRTVLENVAGCVLSGGRAAAISSTRARQRCLTWGCDHGRPALLPITELAAAVRKAGGLLGGSS